MNLLVHTPCGDVQGVVGTQPNCRAFKGIRYATAKRWQYPTPVTHWDGVYDASHFGAASYQPRSFYDEEQVPEKAFYYNEFRKGEHYDYSEDCLFLNVWTPEAPQNTPVILYIHGGGFKGGCGYEKHFDGAALCAKGVIVVTINYRLGPLGFCCLPQLKEEAGHTGNYAIYDQLCALQWVKDNIAAFGGNANNITLMGQSAGAMSVQQLCVSPLANGLVQQAVMLSGGGVSKILNSKATTDTSYSFWQAVMEHTGSTTLEAFRAVTPEALFTAFTAVSKQRKDGMRSCGPLVDGHILTENALTAAKNGHQLSIPYITGATSEDVFPPVIYGMAKGWAKRQAQQGNPSSYTFFFKRQLPGDNKGAWHSSDLWYAFGTLANGWRPFTQWDYHVSDVLTSYLASFAHTGNPNTAGLPQWDAVCDKQNKVMVFGDETIGMGKPNIGKLIHTMLTNKPVGE